MNLIRQLELNTHTAPLGLRFRDLVTGEFAGAGLSVVAYPVANPMKQLPLHPNRSGIYVLHRAPGLRDFEQRALDEVWQSPLPNKLFVIEVRDPDRRVLPFRLSIALPLMGIYSWVSPPGSSPVRPEAGIPLYPANTRQAPAGMAVIRAELFDLVSRRPASWAVIEAYFNNRLVAHGIADEAGRILVIFHYPAPRFSPLSSPVGSPVNGGGKPLHLQEWKLQLRAYYSPSSLPLPESGELPDLQTILSQQQTQLWDDAAMTRQFADQNLQYGSELILRSSEGSLSSPASPPAKPSVLFITPA